MFEPSMTLVKIVVIGVLSGVAFYLGGSAGEFLFN